MRSHIIFCASFQVLGVWWWREKLDIFIVFFVMLIYLCLCVTKRNFIDIHDAS